MPSTESGAHESRAERAEELYVEALADDPGGAGLLARLIEQHPSLTNELRALHAEWSWLDGFRDASRSAPPVAALGDEVLTLIQAPDSVERYERREVIARGGMGVIHRVWDARLGRELAMKVSSARRRSGDGGRVTRRLLRFLDEAHVMGRLQHPGIVPVHDIGVDPEGRGFFTMRLVEGDDLRTVIGRVHRGEPGWDMRRVLRELVSTCDTVAYAHSRGVLHRDLKPANVMVGPFGESYVMDWGLAKVAGRADAELEGVASGATHTVAGAVLGTPAYMPPEQAAGDELDERADVYGIGAMLYHLLTGERPYAEHSGSGSDKLLAEVRRAAPRPIRHAAPDAPLELVAVCERAMARERADRYRGAAELGEDLRAFLETRVVHAYGHGPLTTLSKWVQRNRGTAAALAAALLLVLFGSLIVAALQTSKASALANAGEATRVRAYASNLFAAQAALAIGRADTAREHLERCPAELRGWEWRQVRAGLDGSIAVIELGDAAIECVARMPDGRVAVGTRAGIVHVYDPRDDSARVLIADVGDIVRSVAFSSDGTECAVGTEEGWVRRYALTDQPTELASRQASMMARRLSYLDARTLLVCSWNTSFELWNVEDLSLLRRIRIKSGVAGMAHLDPSGTRLATTTSRNTVRVLDFASGEVLAEAQPLPEWQHWVHSWEVRYTPDGTRLLGAAYDGVLRCFDAETLAHLWSATGHTAHVWTTALNPSGTRVATGSRDHTLRVWDARTGRDLFLGVGHGHSVRNAVWLNDDEVLTGSYDGTLRRWDIGRSSGTAVLPLRTHAVHAATFSPDGQRICTTGRSRQSYVVDAESGAVLAHLWGSAAGSFDNAWDPLGRYIAANYDNGTVCIWDARDYVREERFEIDARGSDLAFTDDGRFLASSDQDGRIHVWRCADWTRVALLELEQPGWTALAFDHAGTRLFVCDGAGRVHVCRVADWTLRTTDIAVPPNSGGRITLSPDDKRLAVAGGDGSILIVETATWAPLLTFRGHTANVTDLDYSPDGTRLASCSMDLTVRVWDVQHGIAVATYAGHQGWVWSTRWSPDGETLLSAGGDKRVVLRESRPKTRRWRAIDEVRDTHMPYIEALYAEDLGLAEVVARIEARTDVDSIGRLALLDLAHALRGDTRKLHLPAWELVKDPRLDAAEHARGLALARQALRFAPDDPATARTYAVALLRTGSPARAVRVLEASSARRPQRDIAERIIDEGFLVLARQAVEEAR